MEAGKEFGILACGLGARNTLRLEAAMALYGHEISEEINLFEAGLERFSKLGKSDFLGSQALLHLQQSGAPKRKLVGLEMIDRGIARDGYKVCSLEGEADRLRDQRLALALLKKNIALAYVPAGPHRAGDGSGGRGARQPGQGQSGADPVLPPREEDSVQHP